MSTPHVVVVGGGISGLAAAWELSGSLAAVDVTVLDASDDVGGKLRRVEIGGAAIDVGAESMLARRPEAIELIHDLGLGAEVVHPHTTSARIWSRGSLHPLPPGTLMGVPSDPRAAVGLLTEGEIARAEAEEPWPADPVETDVSVGEYVAARLGRAVVDRLVEPLLGGVYAGHADRLSLQSTVPALWAAARDGGSLVATARAASEAAVEDSAPVFAGLRGGVGRLAEELARVLRERGVTLRNGVIVRELRRAPAGWELVAGPVPAPEVIEADAVVLAIPATPTARLLREVSQAASAELSGIDYASMAIVTLAVRRDDTWLAALPGSGFLVPPADRRAIKAATFSSTKWEWAAQASAETRYLRASVGRAGEEADLQRDDEELVSVATDEIEEALGHELPTVLDSHVQRWGGALPQYAVGHAGRVERIRAALAGEPGLELAGAAYEGVGIPACIASGRRAAAAVTTHLLARGQRGGE